MFLYDNISCVLNVLVRENLTIFTYLPSPALGTCAPK